MKKATDINDRLRHELRYCANIRSFGGLSHGATNRAGFASRARAGVEGPGASKAIVGN
jgi:hypothetical protein